MSGCGCKGYYHNGACSDKNVIFWLGLDGQLPKADIPVNQTAAELSAQQAIVKQRLKLPESARIIIPLRTHNADEPGHTLSDSSRDWPHLVLPR